MSTNKIEIIALNLISIQSDGLFCYSRYKIINLLFLNHGTI